MTNNIRVLSWIWPPPEVQAVEAGVTDVDDMDHRDRAGVGRRRVHQDPPRQVRLMGG